MCNLMESSPVLFSGKVGEHATRGSGKQRREHGRIKRKTETRRRKMMMMMMMMRRRD
jgi:hypothetical protein